MKKNNMKKLQSGFTLLEMLITLGLVTMFIGITTPLYSRMSDALGNVNTETNIKILGAAIEEWYSENAWDIDLETGNFIMLPDGEVMNNDTNTLSNDGWKQLALKYTSSQKSLIDGNNHAYKVFVSQRLEQSYEGNLIPYHVIVLVSGDGYESPTIANNDNGEDIAVSTIQSTFNDITGEITPHDQDVIYVISGFDIQKRNYEASKKKLEIVAKAYEDYYWSRYVGQGSEPSVNYFGRNGSNIRWDTSANIDVITSNPTQSINGRRVLGSSIYSSNLPEELQLSSSSVTSEWGREFRLLNDGTSDNIQTNGSTETISARTPTNGEYPPYTAILGFTLPNGESHTHTITSKF